MRTEYSTEGFGLEGTSKPTFPQPLPWAGLPHTSSGCPGPHPTWPWAPPGMGHHNFSGQLCQRLTTLKRRRHWYTPWDCLHVQVARVHQQAVSSAAAGLSALLLILLPHPYRNHWITTQWGKCSTGEPGASPLHSVHWDSECWGAWVTLCSHETWKSKITSAPKVCAPTALPHAGVAF